MLDALLGGTATVIAAKSGASTSETVAAGVAGALGGLVAGMLGVFAFRLAVAPFAQREEAREAHAKADEARAEGRRRFEEADAEHERQLAEVRAERDEVPSPDDDPDAFVQRYSEWVLGIRAALPEPPPFSIGSTSLLFDKEAMAQIQSERSVTNQRYKQTYGEVERQARVEYHQRFRQGALAILGNAYRDEAQSPRTIQEFAVVEELLMRRVGTAAQPSSDALAQLREQLNEAHELDTISLLNEQGLPPMDKEKDRLYQWALATWRLLKEHFTEYAREFYGDYPQIGEGYFHTAFSGETHAGRDAYLEQRTRLLERILREKG